MKRSKNLDKLVRYSRRHKVGVRFVDTEIFEDHAPGCVAFYHIDTRQIYISKELKGFEAIYTLAHEIGHAIDFDGMGKKEFVFNRKAVGIANYVMIHTPKISKEHRLTLRDIVIENEIAAFQNGEAVLSLLGIRLPSRLMERDKKSTLRAYRRLFSARRF